MHSRYDGIIWWMVASDSSIQIKLKLTTLYIPLLRISTILSNSLEIRFWNVCPIFEIVGVAFINAHAKIKWFIFPLRFSGNWFNFSIFKNYFWGSITWALQIRLPFTEFKNPKLGWIIWEEWLRKCWPIWCFKFQNIVFTKIVWPETT